MQDRGGLGLSLEPSLWDDLGLFVRTGVADGSKETHEFTDIDRTVAAGLWLRGTRLGRCDDVFAVGVVVSRISKAHQRFLNAGGLGILVGDGKLPLSGDEAIVETHYDAATAQGLRLSLERQLINQPSYNRDRGRVYLVGARPHAQF